jgi:nucleoid DNA-binding protein
MNDIVKYCILLLEEANQVTLPSFGKFELKFNSVKKNIDTHQMLPPYYSLYFTQQHNLNDTCLAEVIAELKSINIDKTKEFVYQTISGWKTILKTDHYLNIENLGTFTTDKEKIIFNLNENSFITYKNFGLPPL